MDKASGNVVLMELKIRVVWRGRKKISAWLSFPEIL